MMAEPISYMTPEPRRRMKTAGRIVAAVLVGLVLLNTAMSIEVCTNRGWICAICGSMRYEKRWIGGFETGQSITQSPLDAWIVQNQGGHAHNWRNIMGSGRNVFGRWTRSGHGRAPPIHGFLPSLLPHYVNAASADQVTAFVRIMQTGTDDEQRRAVDQAADLALEAMAKQPATRSTQ